MDYEELVGIISESTEVILTVVFGCEISNTITVEMSKFEDFVKGKLDDQVESVADSQ